MQAVNTYLAVANVAATMAFLERAFGFTRGVVLPDADGQLRYAEMRHGESAVMLIPKGDAATATSGAAALYTYVDDVDAALARARAAGAGVGEAEDRSWGDRVARRHRSGRLSLGARHVQEAGAVSGVSVGEA